MPNMVSTGGDRKAKLKKTFLTQLKMFAGVYESVRYVVEHIISISNTIPAILFNYSHICMLINLIY